MKTKVFILLSGLLLVAGSMAFFANKSPILREELILRNVEASAEGEPGSTPYWKGYLNNVQDCTVEEIRHCKIVLWFPGYGYCDLGWDYTVELAGKENPCVYTGNEDTQCDYYQCRKNT